MTKLQSEPLTVAWRGLPKRAWFKREKYTYRMGGKVYENTPKLWHAGVDIIQTVDPNVETHSPKRVQYRLRAMCGYVYVFDYWLAANQYGRALYKDDIKTGTLKCPKCCVEMSKPVEDRDYQKWEIPATVPHEGSMDEPWYPNGEDNDHP